MSFVAPFNALLQVIASFFIFVAGYLALAISIILCLVMAELIFERASVVREYGAKPVPASTRVLAGIDGYARTPRHLLRRQFPRKIS